ncbi:MAG: adenosylmethionine--8-amino-7-oxononanoate transaminase [Myxococcota bacterium]
MLPDPIYVTGTDTDVGKTVVSALLAQVLDRAYWKPVQAGRPTDRDTVAALTGVPTHPEALVLERPASPHAALQTEGRTLDLEALTLPAGPLIVEGAGGWMVPYSMTDDHVVWQADVVRHLRLPVIVVARSGLGTLNHTLSTLRAIRADGIVPVGLILVGPAHPENERDLPRLGGVPVLARLDRATLPDDAPKLAASLRQQLDQASPGPVRSPGREAEGLWHPFTQLKGFVPRGNVVRAEGAWLTLGNGRRVLDGISSWWVTLHGHSHPAVMAAIAEQAHTFDQVILADFAHGPAVELSAQLAQVLPGDVDHVFYSDDGSTSVEVALKMALQGHRQLGANRTRFVAFDGAYHGDTAGAMSVGERGPFTDAFEPMMFDVTHLPYDDADALDAWLDAHGHEVAGVILEPMVQGAAGMRFCSAEFLVRVRAACDRVGAWMITDEVFTGFGRTGRMWASDHANLVPDIMCLSKGLTGGSIAMGATACRTHIFEAFLDDDHARAFLHGHSYTGSPIACAASLASLALFETEGTLARVAAIEAAYTQASAPLRDLEGVENLRIRGDILAYEVKGGPGGYFDPVGRRICDRAFAEDLYVRPLGNTLYMVPPLCTTPAEIAWAVDILIRATRAELGRGA